MLLSLSQGHEKVNTIQIGLCNNIFKLFMVKRNVHFNTTLRNMGYNVSHCMYKFILSSNFKWSKESCTSFLIVSAIRLTLLTQMGTFPSFSLSLWWVSDIFSQTFIGVLLIFGYEQLCGGVRTNVVNNSI